MTPFVLFALAAAAATIPAPIPGIGPGNSNRPVLAASGELAWDVALDAVPDGRPRSIAVPGAESLVLLPLADRIEARATKDGSVRWTRSDLPGRGLMLGDPIVMHEGLAAGWAGIGADGVGRLVVFALSTGATVFESALAAPPSGPPSPVFTGDRPSGSRWFVPLVSGGVAAIGPAGEAAGSFPFLSPVVPPVVEVEGQGLAALDRSEANAPKRPGAIDLVPLGTSAKVAARDLFPRTASYAAATHRLYGAGDRTFAAWRCRTRSNGSVGCHLSWRQNIGGTVTATPLVTPTRVVVPSWDTLLYAFLPKNGHLAWRVRAGARLETPPLAWDEQHVAVLVEGSASVLFFDLENGQSAGRVAGAAGDVFVQGMARAGDLLVVPALAEPAATPTLRAYRVTLKAQEKKPGAAGATDSKHDETGATPPAAPSSPDVKGS